MKCNLLLHCGASAVRRNALQTVVTPPSTASWQPIPHQDLLVQVESSLDRAGFGIVEEAHGLTHDGSRYFGLIQVRNGHRSADYTWVLGIRNSHDKTLPAGLVAGSQVFVCDNLSFNGDIKVVRKHTVHIMRDLPMLIDGALAQLVGQWQKQDRRIEAYKSSRVTDRYAHDLTIRALDAEAITVTQIPDILKEWREPLHEEFRPRTMWSWFNAVTENLKGNLGLLPQRTEALYDVCDSFVGVN